MTTVPEEKVEGGKEKEKGHNLVFGHSTVPTAIEKAARFFTAASASLSSSTSTDHACVFIQCCICRFYHLDRNKKALGFAWCTVVVVVWVMSRIGN